MVVVLVAAGGMALYVRADHRVRHVAAVGDHPAGPPGGTGTNWLLVASDSRAGLSPQQRRELHVGIEEAGSTDTVMLLHSGAHGGSLVSLPRDSYVPVPGHGRGKLNEAYARGGPRLLTRTVEQATGLRVDHFAEVDFLGFVRVVDTLGGVRLCLPKPLRDARSGADFPAGCRRMDGARALAYVRARHGDPAGDLGRVKRQRQLIGAVADAALGAGVLFNPFRLVPVVDAALAAVRVDQGAGLGELVGLGRAMKKIADGGGAATTVPVADPGVPMGEAGEVLLWDEEKARRLFRALREDDPIPTSGDN